MFFTDAAVNIDAHLQRQRVLYRKTGCKQIAARCVHPNRAFHHKKKREDWNLIAIVQTKPRVLTPPAQLIASSIGRKPFKGTV